MFFPDIKKACSFSYDLDSEHERAAEVRAELLAPTVKRLESAGFKATEYVTHNSKTTGEKVWNLWTLAGFYSSIK